MRGLKIKFKLSIIIMALLLFSSPVNADFICDLFGCKPTFLIIDSNSTALGDFNITDPQINQLIQFDGFFWVNVDVNSVEDVNNANLLGGVPPSGYWRIDGTSAPPTSNWNMGGFSFTGLPNISNTGAINLKPSNDSDDYFIFSTVGGTPQINIAGGNDLNILANMHIGAGTNFNINGQAGEGGKFTFYNITQDVCIRMDADDDSIEIQNGCKLVLGSTEYALDYNSTDGEAIFDGRGLFGTNNTRLRFIKDVNFNDNVNFIDVVNHEKVASFEGGANILQNKRLDFGDNGGTDGYLIWNSGTGEFEVHSKEATVMVFGDGFAQIESTIPLYFNSSNKSIRGSTNFMTLNAPAYLFNITGENPEAFKVVDAANGIEVMNYDADDIRLDLFDSLMSLFSSAVGIGTTAPVYPLDIVGGSVGSGLLQLRLGNNDTNGTSKVGGFSVRHQDNAEQDISGLFALSLGTANIFAWGGGDSLLNAATSHRFYVAGNDRTIFGTNVLELDLTTADFKNIDIKTTGDVNWLAKTYMGSNDGNFTEIDINGDVLFYGGAGLAFGEIYTTDSNAVVTISGTGEANKVQVTIFDVDGLSNNTIPDHTNDHITITNQGIYFLTGSITAESLGGQATEFSFDVFKNNGATGFANLHAHRGFSGGGGDTGSVGLSGFIDLALNDTIELWIWNETNTQNIILDDITLSLVQIGGN